MARKFKSEIKSVNDSKEGENGSKSRPLFSCLPLNTYDSRPTKVAVERFKTLPILKFKEMQLVSFNKLDISDLHCFNVLFCSLKNQ